MNLIGIQPEVLGDAPGKGAHTREMRQKCRIGNPNHLMHCIYQVLGRSPADGGLFRNDVLRAFAQGIQTGKYDAPVTLGNAACNFVSGSIE